MLLVLVDRNVEMELQEEYMSSAFGRQKESRANDGGNFLVSWRDGNSFVDTKLQPAYNEYSNGQLDNATTHVQIILIERDKIAALQLKAIHWMEDSTTTITRTISKYCIIHLPF